MRDEEEEKEGYIGRAKDVLHILYERGLWVQNIRKSLTENDLKQKLLKDPTFIHESHLYADTVLGNCLDIRNERTELQDLVETRGHILLISVKCHPECAGAGIEYCWG